MAWIAAVAKEVAVTMAAVVAAGMPGVWKDLTDNANGMARNEPSAR